MGYPQFPETGPTAAQMRQRIKSLFYQTKIVETQPALLPSVFSRNLEDVCSPMSEILARFQLAYGVVPDFSKPQLARAYFYYEALAGKCLPDFSTVEGCKFALLSNDEDVRLAAAKKLGDFGTDASSALSRLETIAWGAEEKSFFVRLAAMDAIQKIREIEFQAMGIVVANTVKAGAFMMTGNDSSYEYLKLGASMGDKI